MNKLKLWTAEFVLIIINSLLMFSSYYMLMAILPLYTVQIFGVGPTISGLLLTTFIIGALIARLFIGNVLDLYKRKNILVLSSIIFVISNFLYLETKTLGFLLLLRVIHGCAYGMLTTTLSTLATDIIPSSRKAEGMGYYGIGMSIGMTLGPLIGVYVLSNYEFHTVFIISFTLTVLMLLISLSIKESQSTSEKPKLSKSLKINRLIEPSVLKVSLIVFVLAMAYSSVSSFVSTYAQEANKTSASSYFFLCYGIALIISRPFIGKLFDRITGNIVIYLSYVTYFLGMIILSFSVNLYTFSIAGLLLGLGFGSIFPCLQAIMIKNANTHRLGTANSTYYLFFDTGIAIGSFILGNIATYTGYEYMFRIAGLIISFSFLLYYFFYINRSNNIKHVKKKLL